MPEFTVRFSRKVVSRDEYVETIEAATLEEAEAKAEALADEFNHSCPDGVEETSMECQSWTVDDVATGAEAKD